MTDGLMTVARLIELLVSHDQNARVVVPSSDGGFFDLKDASPALLALHVNTFGGAGPHDHADAHEVEPVPAVILQPLD